MYQTALEVTLERGSVGQAIQFIRRLQDIHNSDVQGMRVIR